MIHTTDTALARAREGDESAFRELTAPYERELLLHCYRILGSLQDAEDVLQETMLAAWRGLAGFEERASVRAWLYRIATNRCLNALRDSGRRPRVARALLFDPPEPTRYAEPLWLDPYPDALLEGLPDVAPGPDARYETKEAVALAFVTGLQGLAPRQRAVLVLRDVLGFRAAEVADMLATSEVSVNSALQRARDALERRLPADRDHAGARERALLPHDPRERELVTGFADAFTSGDVDRVVALLTDDAWVSMPPEPFEYQGAEAITRFLRARIADRSRGPVRLLETRANGQPAFGHYVARAGDSVARDGGILVLTLTGDGISGLTRFGGEGLVARFGLPATVPE